MAAAFFPSDRAFPFGLVPVVRISENLGLASTRGRWVLDRKPNNHASRFDGVGSAATSPARKAAASTWPQASFPERRQRRSLGRVSAGWMANAHRPAMRPAAGTDAGAAAPSPLPTAGRAGPDPARTAGRSIRDGESSPGGIGTKRMGRPKKRAPPLEVKYKNVIVCPLVTTHPTHASRMSGGPARERLEWR
jgi:hypothetical protein